MARGCIVALVLAGCASAAAPRAERPAAEPSGALRQRLEEALALRVEGETAAALAIYDELLAAEPEAILVWLQYSACLRGLNRLARAAQAAWRAVELGPEDHDAWANVVNVLLDAGDWEAAQAALALAPSSDTFAGFAAAAEEHRRRGEEGTAKLPGALIPASLRLRPTGSGGALGVALPASDDRYYEVPPDLGLVVHVPETWGEGRAATDVAVTLTWRPASGDAWRVTLTATPAPEGFDAAAQLATAVALRRAGARAEERGQELAAQSFDSDSVVGGWFWASDASVDPAAPQPGQYPYAMAAVGRAGPLMLNVDVLARDDSEALRDLMAKTLGSSRGGAGEALRRAVFSSRP